MDALPAAAGVGREFLRVLAWLTRPISSPERFAALAATTASATTSASPRLAVVLELLTGVPPAKLAARERITEAELYAWRGRALADARAALDDEAAAAATRPRRSPGS